MSYNKPDDWVERNRIGLEKVKRQLQSCIDSVSPKFELALIHHNIGWDQRMDNEAPIVWHDPILDRYWDQLEELIKQQDIVTDIECINIENVEITKERLAALVDICSSGIATNSSIDVMFNNANLCDKGIVWLSKLVEVSSQLQTLVINHNRIDNMESALCLSGSLKLHTCIKMLELSHCDLGNTPEMLSVILQSDVEIIYLDNNNIDSLGAVTIAEYLESDPPIVRLVLACNRLNDNDAILISQALKRNTNMRHLLLEGNNFTSIGVKALLTCVFDSSSLNAISESNHTLVGMNIFSKINNKKLQRCIDRLLELDQFQKIVLALQDKDSLLKYLTNVPVELIPEVLAFPHGRVDDQYQYKYLNIVYSTMRWWNMPMLYSYLNCVKSDAKRKRNDLL